MPAAASRAASVTSGAGPGRTVSERHPSGSAGRTPACTNELLPAPDGPTTASIGVTRSRLTNASVSRSRP